MPVAAPRRDPLDVPIDGLEARLPQRAALGAPVPSAAGRSMTGSPSMRMNHCDVARKITGLWQRQQCGYECWKSCAVPEPRALLERLLDARVGVEHLLAAEELDRVEEVTAGADRGIDVQPVAHAGDEVVGAVARRGVHGAGARLRA